MNYKKFGVGGTAWPPEIWVSDGRLQVEHLSKSKGFKQNEMLFEKIVLSEFWDSRFTDCITRQKNQSWLPPLGWQHRGQLLSRLPRTRSFLQPSGETQLNMICGSFGRVSKNHCWRAERWRELQRSPCAAVAQHAPAAPGKPDYLLEN